MSIAEDGNTVKIHYKGTLDDGSVFDSSEGRDPLEFKVASGMVIKGFDDAVRGMKVDETKTTRIPPVDAYGEKNDEMVISVPKEMLPPDMDVKIGDKLQMTTQEGQPVPVTIVEMGDDELKVDANHELAGQALTFEITLVEIS
ncbi:MAG: FKBP-type peptidyl-prolyl cis-trans isomerase [Lentisphaeria bacterium]|nr:FKBP-type peptidyl-prolyl cis-trans isomerase [Lentisphaeria bacterium]NQZ70224.1 FKBP-type peptidyl-prolyl cis-trans isomerase [Lentisphaeria bacterium]